MYETLSKWMNNRDPVEYLAFQQNLRKIKSKPQVLQAIIKKYLLDNKHKAVIHIYPSQAELEKLQSKEELLLKHKLKKENLKKMVEDFTQFNEWTQKGLLNKKREDSLPHIKISQIGKKINL